jgi:hypothetical protein
MAPDAQKPPECVTPGSRGYCPVCGAEVLWTQTAALRPSRRSAQSVLPGQSGTCSHCHRVLMFTVVYDPAADAESKTR